MRVLFALSGLHRVSRGAEIAFQEIASGIVRDFGDDVVLAGSGPALPDRPYHFEQIHSLPRERFERWPRIPPLRSEVAYEELTFAIPLARWSRRQHFDVAVTCGYPFTSWALRGAIGRSKRPPHVFVTQNGDWPAISRRGEYRFFSCDGLVCTNPTYFERNQRRWPSILIPNGVDPSSFRPGPDRRAELRLPPGPRIVLMVSALIESKRVPDGIRAVAGLDDVHLVVAGGGPQRDEIALLAERLLPDRFTCRTFLPSEMPDLYRSCDVFLHLAEAESFGNVYVEAMATGVPVVAHDSELTRWILGDVGLLLDTTDTEAIAEGIAVALREPPDARARRRRQAELRFSWTMIAREYRAFLEDVRRRAVA